MVVPTADPLETPGEEIEPELANVKAPRVKISSLTAEDKWRLLRPLIGKYMLPLCELPLRLECHPVLTSHRLVCVYTVSVSCLTSEA